MSSPRPRPSAVPPTRKYGTSAPSRAPIRVSVARSRSSFHSLFSASSVMAASALPPPSPASLGMRLRRSIEMPCGAVVLPVDDAVQQRRGLPHQVAPIGRDVFLVADDLERPAPPRHRDLVEQRQALKDGAQIVIAVGTRAENPQVEVDLGKRRQADRRHHGFLGDERRDRAQFVEGHRVGVGWYFQRERERVDRGVHFEFADPRGDIGASHRRRGARARRADSR